MAPVKNLDEVDVAVKRALAQSVWLNKSKYDEAEATYQRHLAKGDHHKANCFGVTEGKSSLVDEIARTRQQIKHSLQSCEENGADLQSDCLQHRLQVLEKDYNSLLKVVDQLVGHQKTLQQRVEALEKGSGKAAAPQPKAAPAKVESKKAAEDDDEVDLFASDDEEDEAERAKLHTERVKAYEEKKSKKAAVIAKSSIILDVKPWDDETDMKQMQEAVRSIQMEGLVWGAAKLVPLAYGIFKLQIACVVEDEKVSVDDLQEQIEGLEDLVQSVDVAAFNKV